MFQLSYKWLCGLPIGQLQNYLLSEINQREELSSAKQKPCSLERGFKRCRTNRTNNNIMNIYKTNFPTEQEGKDYLLSIGVLVETDNEIVFNLKIRLRLFISVRL